MKKKKKTYAYLNQEFKFVADSAAEAARKASVATAVIYQILKQERICTKHEQQKKLAEQGWVPQPVGLYPGVYRFGRGYGQYLAIPDAGLHLGRPDIFNPVLHLRHSDRLHRRYR